jgi:sec-independent protein translocase protein TatC
MAAREVEGSFWDHLEEARGCILRSLLYIALATGASWVFRTAIFNLLRYPAEAGARWANVPDFAFRIFDPAGGLTLMMEASLVGGLVLSAPLWLMEIVRFVSPGLTPPERRAALLLVPGAVLLFVGGVAFCYMLSPSFFAWLFAFNRSLGVQPEVALSSYLHFFLQVVVVFGLSFELPLVIMFLVHFGILTSAQLLQYWRGAVVIILIIAAVATPTVDPVTMSLMAAPMVLLYFLAIWLARMVEPHHPEPEARAEDETSANEGDNAALDAELLGGLDSDPYGLSQPGGEGLGEVSDLTEAEREVEEFYRRHREGLDESTDDEAPGSG